MFDAEITDLPHVGRAACSVKQAVKLLASAGLVPSGGAPIVLQTFACAAMATATLLYSAATYVKGRPKVMGVINRAWFSGLLLNNK